MAVKPHQQRFGVSFVLGMHLILILSVLLKVDAFAFQRVVPHPSKVAIALTKLDMLPHQASASSSQPQHTTTTTFMAASAAMDPSDFIFDRTDALLPYFQVANGLLSPQTVKNLDDKARIAPAGSNSALYLFLDTYKRCGPMACLPMLSDPQVLPHLTRALRESYNK